MTNPANYIYPPRAKDAIPINAATFFANLGWVAQLKYNDSRCLIKYQPNKPIELWNRHNATFKTFTPSKELLTQLHELHDQLGLSKNHWHLLDGGILDQKHPAIKQTIAIWDILVKDSEHQLTTTYKHRYDFLTGKTNNGTYTFTNKNGTYDLGTKINTNLLIPINYTGNLAGTTNNDGNPPGDAWMTLWTELVEKINAPYDQNSPLIEGLVLKWGDGKLKSGYKPANNSDWMVKSRVHTGRHRF